MQVIELAKSLNVIDLLLLILDEKGFSDAEIASIMEVSKQTIHNSKKRNMELLEALKMVKSPPKEYGNKDINAVIKAFTDSFGTTKTTKYDRFAAKRLSDKYEPKIIVGAIRALSASQSDKYCPSVRSVTQFEEKLPNIIRYLKNKSTDGVLAL